MTKQELCRAIAEKLEPCLPDIDWTVFPRPEKMISGKGFWKYVAYLEQAQPIDFFTSEDASARLLEAMPKGLVGRDVDGWKSSYAGFLCVDHEIFTHPDRKTAIVLAAKAWLEIPGELDAAILKEK